MHQGGQPGNHRNFRIRIACQRTGRHRSKEDKAEGSSNIGRSVSRHNLTHVAILGPLFWDPPFWDLKNKKSVHIATFLRLRTVALPSISNIGVNAQVIGRATTRFRFTGTKKRVPNRKKVAKIPEFLFLQQANHRDKADPRKLSNEDRVEAKRGAKGSCHPSGPRPSGTPAS